MLFTSVDGTNLSDASLQGAYLRKIDLRTALLKAEQLLKSEIFGITNLPSEIEGDPRIQARIDMCEAALAARNSLIRPVT
ncbi:pentapeptide repeat-containing protein [Streptomyces fructofermentans]|uniref:pentapeptide repeat-containing protein n=1 Tax=Streptomyces fructofermentans TaxID=152141 RepID=UPI0033D8FF27